MAYRLKDLLAHLVQTTLYGLPDERIAPALGVPADYLWVLREAAGLEMPAKPQTGGADDLPHR
jgi:hypothetical protein